MLFVIRCLFSIKIFSLFLVNVNLVILLNPADHVQSLNTVSHEIAARIQDILGSFRFLELGFVLAAYQLFLGHQLSRQV
jgi:hypothetical protein